MTLHEQVEAIDHEAPSRQPVRKLNEMKPQSPFTGRPGVGHHDAGRPARDAAREIKPIVPPQSKEERDGLPVEVAPSITPRSVRVVGGTVHRGPRWNLAHHLGHEYSFQPTSRLRAGGTPPLNAIRSLPTEVESHL